MAKLSSLLWIWGSDTGIVFPIWIQGGMGVNVHDLKCAIRASMKARFDHLAAQQLLLFKVAIPTKDLASSIQGKNDPADVVGAEQLDPAVQVDDLFQPSLTRTIRIIVSTSVPESQAQVDSSSAPLPSAVDPSSSSQTPKRKRECSTDSNDEGSSPDGTAQFVQPSTGLRDMEKLSTLCKSSSRTRVKVYTSQSGEVVSYIDFDDETLRGLRTVFTTCPQKLIIRSEYKEALEYLETNTGTISGICVTGQPGIGKSLFLVYTLFLRLQKGLATAFQTPDKKSYVIVDGKAYSLDDDDAPGLPSPLAPVWALSDSNLFTPFPTVLFQRHDFCIIHATSPQMQRHQRWMKRVGGEVWIMDLWPKAELEALGDLCDGVTKESLLPLAGQYGCSPRAILELARSPHTQSAFVTKLNIAIKRLVDNPQPLLRDFSEINLTDELSSTILYIQPAVLGTQSSRRQPGLSLPSRYIAELIMDELAQKGVATQAEFFSRMNAYPLLRCTCAGWIYEAFIHTIITSLVVLPCTWVRSPSSTTTPALIHGVGPHQAVPTREDLKIARLPFYWRPKGSDYRGTDAVLCDGQNVFMIRACATIDSEPRPIASPIPGIDDFREIATDSDDQAVKALPEHLLYVGQNEEACQSLCATAAEDMTGNEWENVSIGYCVVKLNRRSIYDMLLARSEAA
ncbi:hypothetical protein BDN72DRAFT_899639 [Pluteus cervinus]|uniref:Uncharacterized protein n=1 Tax=Pluteus cervinus TaxID=181527 RepID=A0ACD3AM17_9AGAR|nr:hypothetical protein BDN72DRAFT_899639 [Pluteus cervinus]